jgi:hypothetical protein
MPEEKEPKFVDVHKLVIDIRITCPGTVPDGRGGHRICGQLHVDEGEFLTKPHHTHTCQYCGCTWRPAVIFTRGVRFLPGYKNPFPPESGPALPGLVPEERVSR